MLVEVLVIRCIQVLHNFRVTDMQGRFNVSEVKRSNTHISPNSVISQSGHNEDVVILRCLIQKFSPKATNKGVCLWHHFDALRLIVIPQDLVSVTAFVKQNIEHVGDNQKKCRVLGDQPNDVDNLLHLIIHFLINLN